MLVYLTSFILGAITKFAFAPYNLVFIAVISISVFFVLLRNSKNVKNAFFIGFSFGFSFHLSTAYWIFYPIIDNGFFAFIIFAPVLIGYFAMFSAVPALIFKASKIQNCLSFAFLFASFELFRATFLTGYPLYLLGYTFNFSQQLMQINSIVGIFGTTFIAYIITSCAGDLFSTKHKLVKYIRITFVNVSLIVIIILATFTSHTNLNIEKNAVLIVQPNGKCLLSDLKCKEKIFHNSIKLLKQHKHNNVKYVILPESIIPYSATKQEIEHLMSKILISNNFKNQYFILGALTKENRSIYTSMLLLNINGQILETYNKAHLVPFGEVLPIGKTLKSTLFSNLDFLSRGEKDSSIKRDSLKIKPLICYESLFSNEINIDGEQFIVNISNDSWYHNSNARSHILEATRVRAIETGLPIYRSTINGISAVISKTGQIIQKIDENKMGVINSSILDSKSPTFYSKYKQRILKIWYITFVISTIINTFLYFRERKSNFL